MISILSPIDTPLKICPVFSEIGNGIPTPSILTRAFLHRLDCDVLLILQIQANTALAAELGMCGIIMQSILMDLPTSPRTAPRDSNYLNGFVSPYLATQDYVSASWTSYTSALILLSSSAPSYKLISLIQKAFILGLLYMSPAGCALRDVNLSLAVHNYYDLKTMLMQKT